MSFSDEGELHYASPDLVLLHKTERFGLVIEAKATRSVDGRTQLVGVYIPLVKRLWPNTLWSHCQAFKHWAGQQDLVLAYTLEEVLQWAEEGGRGFGYELFWNGD